MSSFNAGKLLATIPGWLGFVPAGCLVVTGLDAPAGKTIVTLRYDLPDPPDAGIATDLAAHAAGVLARQHAETAVVVGYGPARLVTPVTDKFSEQATAAGLGVLEVLRVQDGRYWSYLCQQPGCCPPEGKPLPQTPPADGEGRVLGSREELAATIATVTGAGREIARQATRRARQQAEKMMSQASAKHGRRRLAAAGIQSVTDAITSYRQGGRITDPGQLASITVALRDLRVRDDAWARMDPEHSQQHLAMWTDLTRHAMPGYVAAPACLLTFTAWQLGDGALANVALDRAMADQPGYSMAQLLRQAIGGGIPPSAARLPMTPEEVAASYAALDDEADTPASPAGEPGDPGTQPATP